MSQLRHRFATTLATLSLSAAVALASANAVAQQPEHAHSADHSAGHGQQVTATNPAAQRKAAIEATESFINAHKQWAQSRGASNKAAALENLVAKAEARRELMAELIRTNPAEALRVAIPEEKQKGMPAEVQAMLEQRFEVEGELEVLYVDNFEDPSKHRQVELIKTNFGERIELHRGDKSHDLATGTTVRAYGLVLDGGSAQLDTNADLAVANNDDLQTLAIGGDTDSSEVLAAPVTPTMGEQKVLAIIVNFQDDPNNKPFTADYVRAKLSDVDNFIQENSYGQAWVNADVTGYHTIPMSSNSCVINDIASYAQQAASSAGIDLSAYNRFFYIYPDNDYCSFSGLGTVGGTPSQSWINGFSGFSVAAHELGHNLGLRHSNAWYCDDGVLTGSCSHINYGDKFDNMGTGGSKHFNAYQKDNLGWLGSRIKTVTQSGVYNLSPFEVEGPQPLAIKVLQGSDPQTGTDTWYYLESRKRIGFDSSLLDGNAADGILIHTGQDPVSNTSYLLDMTPGSISYFWDAALEAGYSYTDNDSGVSFTTEVVDEQGAQVSITLNGSQTSCVRANPSISLTPGQSDWVEAGTTVSYSVTLTNNDNSACNNASFNLSASQPNGWSAGFGSSSLTLAPGASATTTLTVTSASTATDGFYTIGVNANNGGYSAGGDVIYVVDNPVSNSAPVANNDSASTEADTAVSIPVLANDSDADGDNLNITAFSGVTGAVVDNGNGTITFTPAAGFSGTESFSYTISDGRGGNDSATVSVNVAEAPVQNSAPVAGNDSATTEENTAVTIPVLTNDSDADGDSLTITSFSGVNGSVVNNGDGTITFTPAAGFSGTETFNYVVSDGSGGTDSASVTVTVNAVPVDSNNAPVAVNDSVTLSAVTTITIAVLNNDSDPEGDNLKVESVTQGAKGSVTINTDGTVTYSPHKSFKSSDSFSYTISDGKKTATATVSLQLQTSTDGSGGPGSKGNGKKK